MIQSNPDKEWDWEYISWNPNITWEIVQDNPDRDWNWFFLSGNPNITSPRLVTWIRFSSMPAQSYYLDRSYLFKDSLNEINKKFGRSTTL